MYFFTKLGDSSPKLLRL